MRRSDTVADGRLHLDQIIVAGNHQRLLGRFVSVRGEMGAVPGQICLLARIAIEADLRGANAVSFDAHDAIDRPGPAPGQAGLQVRSRLSETENDRGFIRTDLR